MLNKDDQETINTIAIRHPGLIPEGHPDRFKIAQHINNLRTSNPNEARRLHDRFISGGGQYTKDKLQSDDLNKIDNGVNLVLSNYFEGSSTSPHEYHYSVHKDGNEIGRAIVFNKDPRSIHSQGREGASLKDIRIKPELHGKGFSGHIINSLVQKHGPLASDSRGNISEAGHKMFSKYGSAVKSKENKDLYMLGEDMEKSDKNHPKGGLSRKEAKKHGIHAGIETHDEVKRKGGVSKLSDKTSARRRSFCARHCGMKRKFPTAYKDPQSKGNKALRVWHCGSCSNWLKKSIGDNDAVRFYEDKENLVIEFDNDVPHEVETLIVASLLAKGFEENE